MSRSFTAKTKEARRNRDLTPSASANEMREILDKCTPALQEKIKSIESRHSQNSGSTLLYHWTIGMECREVAERRAVYGEQGIAAMLEYFDVCYGNLQLRKCRKFAELYSREQYDDLVALRNEHTGYRITFSHVIALCVLPTEEMRRKFAYDAVRMNWDAKELRERIQKKLGVKDARNTGRPHSMPDTLAAQVRQMHTVTQAWIDKRNKVWHGEAGAHRVIANLDKAPPEEITPELISLLDETVKSFATMIEDGDATRESLQEVANRIRDRIKGRGEPQAAPSEEDED